MKSMSRSTKSFFLENNNSCCSFPYLDSFLHCSFSLQVRFFVFRVTVLFIFCAFFNSRFHCFGFSTCSAVHSVASVLQKLFALLREKCTVWSAKTLYKQQVKYTPEENCPWSHRSGHNHRAISFDNRFLFAAPIFRIYLLFVVFAAFFLFGVFSVFVDFFHGGGLWSRFTAFFISKEIASLLKMYNMVQDALTSEF